MPNRVLHPRLYNESWGRLARDIMILLIVHRSDGVGMAPEEVGVYASMLAEQKDKPLPLAQVKRALAVLSEGEKPGIIRFQAGGAPYLIIRKFQEWQKIPYPVTPTCPYPPEDVLERLGPLTRGWLDRNYGNIPPAAYKELASQYRVNGKILGSYSEVISKFLGSGSEVPSVKTPSTLSPPPPPPQEPPPIPPPTATADPVEWYYDAYEAHLGRAPKRSVVRHSAPCRAAEAEFGRERVQEAFLRYLADPWWRERGCPVEAFYRETTLMRFLNGEGVGGAGALREELGVPPEVELPE